MLARSRPDLEVIFATLAPMRDALIEVDMEVGSRHGDARPDLDAAIRWHGARLDELING